MMIAVQRCVCGHSYLVSHGANTDEGWDACSREVARGLGLALVDADSTLGFFCAGCRALHVLSRMPPHCVTACDQGDVYAACLN